MPAFTTVGHLNLDISFLTIHGQSRFPGLFIWLRNGERIPVKVPKGCFLLQAAKQLEIMTAGHIYAGFHEVIVTEETLKAAEKARREGRSLWRVSSTMFSAIRYDEVLKPLDMFRDSVRSSDAGKLQQVPPDPVLGAGRGRAQSDRAAALTHQLRASSPQTRRCRITPNCIRLEPKD